MKNKILLGILGSCLILSGCNKNITNDINKENINKNEIQEENNSNIEINKELKEDCYDYTLIQLWSGDYTINFKGGDDLFNYKLRLDDSGFLDDDEIKESKQEYITGTFKYTYNNKNYTIKLNRYGLDMYYYQNYISLYLRRSDKKELRCEIRISKEVSDISLNVTNVYYVAK